MSSGYVVGHALVTFCRQNVSYKKKVLFDFIDLIFRDGRPHRLELERTGLPPLSITTTNGFVELQDAQNAWGRAGAIQQRPGAEGMTI